jgi:uncharacterized protein (TIGR02466 family)
MEEKVKLTVAFPNWIGIHDWTKTKTPDGTSWKKFNDKLKLDLYKMRAGDGDGIYRSNLAGTWHSKDTVITETESGEELGKMVHHVMSAVANQYGGDPKGVYSWKFAAWCMMYRDRGYSTPHTHPNCHFSGVYYVDNGEPLEAEPLTMATGVKIQPGTFEAIDPAAGNLAAPGINLQPGFRLIPKAGQMIVFPSGLSHFVHPVQGDSERICVACNGSLIDYKEGSSNVSNK